MNLKPLADRVVVKVLEAEEKTASGIVLPDKAKEKPQEGEVMAVGGGKVLDNGTKVEMEVKVGDKVIGSAQVKMPDLYGSDGFKDFSFDPSTGITTSSGQNWTGELVDNGSLYYLNLWAQSASDYLNPGESVSATFTATTPTETGIYTFETEAWTDAAASGIGSTTNNMAAGYEDPTVGVFEINSPVLISNVAELELLSSLTNSVDLAKEYLLTNNIDFADNYDESDWLDWNGGKGFLPIGSESNPFTGSFDGGNYTISNLFIELFLCYASNDTL